MIKGNNRNISDLWVTSNEFTRGFRLVNDAWDSKNICSSCRVIKEMF